MAIGKKLLLMQWRHSAAWTAWCPTSDTDTVDGFQYIRVCIFLTDFNRSVIIQPVSVGKFDIAGSPVSGSPINAFSNSEAKGIFPNVKYPYLKGFIL